MHSGKDWALLLQSHLILSLACKVFDKDWIQRLPNQDHFLPLCVQCVGFRNHTLEINLKNLKRFTWVRDHW